VAEGQQDVRVENEFNKNQEDLILAGVQNNVRLETESNDNQKDLILA
jgi:hypothetical protein